MDSCFIPVLHSSHEACRFSSVKERNALPCLFITQREPPHRQRDRQCVCREAPKSVAGWLLPRDVQNIPTNFSCLAKNTGPPARIIAEGKAFGSQPVSSKLVFLPLCQALGNFTSVVVAQHYS